MDITNTRKILNFDINQFPFQKLFAQHLNVQGSELENLHMHLPENLIPSSMVTVDDDQNQAIYKLLYEIDEGYRMNTKNTNGNFLDLFQDFVSYLSKTIFYENLIYQNKPTLRINFPNNKAVGAWHRDRDYNHPAEEINIWVPITTATMTNTIWTESSFDLEDYSPANQEYGEFLIFDSGLKHGNQLNIENRTRISFDFRVIPESLYQENSSSSYSQNIPFELGQYYSITSNEF
jgi:hypothetical protein